MEKFTIEDWLKGNVLIAGNPQRVIAVMKASGKEVPPFVSGEMIYGFEDGRLTAFGEGIDVPIQDAADFVLPEEEKGLPLVISALERQLGIEKGWQTKRQVMISNQGIMVFTDSLPPDRTEYIRQIEKAISILK